MTVVDAHMHVLDSSWIPEGVRAAWARQAAGRRHPEREPADLLNRVMSGNSDPTGERTVRAFDRAGVDCGVMATVDWTIVGAPSDGHLDIRELHRRSHALGERWPGRLFHLAGIDPRHTDSLDIVHSALESSWCVGLKLYPGAGWALDDLDYGWVFELALELDLPVQVHTSPLGGDPLDTVLNRPTKLGTVLSRYPDLQMVFGHSGFEAWWLEAIDIAAGWRRTYLEISLWDDLARRDYSEFRKRIGLMLHRVGAHRVIFGSDIIRGDRSDPEGDELAQWVEMIHGLAVPFKGEAPVASLEEVDMVLGESARIAYRLH